MNDDKLMFDIKSFNENLKRMEETTEKPVLVDLITRYRQLEKDNELLSDRLSGAVRIANKSELDRIELLAALKRYNETIENYVTMESQIPFDDPAYKDDVEIINKVRQITKHKGE